MTKPVSRRVAEVLVALVAATVASACTGAVTATAQPGGVDQRPVMGWSSWSFLRFGLNSTEIEAEAQALVTSGLASAGYDYVNIDDGWYQCPGSQGPNVDQYGRWLVDDSEFPNVDSENGIQAVADYVHSLGLKFGIYETAGISAQAVAANTPILGTSYTADQIATSASQANYNCGGMMQIDYSAPGAQPYVDSVVDELASWGVDYIKLDGISNANVADIEAWSAAIAQSGRAMVLDVTQGSITSKIAAVLKRYANQWEFAPDIELNGPNEGSGSGCYSPPYSGCTSVFPLTSYSHWADRFKDVATWQPYGGPGGFNDYDSIEVGDGSANSGMTTDASESQLSLWALASAPLILGGDLTGSVSNLFGDSSSLDPGDVSLLTNQQVIDVDQDGVDASVVWQRGADWVFSKKEHGGGAVVGLFDAKTNLSAPNDTIDTKASAIGLSKDSAGYEVQNLWTGQTSTISAAGKIVAEVPSEGVALYRITKLTSASLRRARAAESKVAKAGSGLRRSQSHKNSNEDSSGQLPVERRQARVDLAVP